jgi:hypothetical protein
MSRSRPPSWYESGNIEATLRSALTTANVPTEEIVDVLRTHEIDKPRKRFETLVETSRERFETQSTNNESVPALDDLRGTDTRVVDATDLEYLRSPDRARVLGCMLSQYGGGFRIPEDDTLAIDLLWNRQYTTVGVRLELAADDSPVGESVIDALSDGNTTPTAGRAPSTLAIVSSTGFTDTAKEAAAAVDIELQDSTQLRRWCQETRLTHKLLGQLLEQQVDDQDEFEALFADRAPLPDAVSDADPFEDVSIEGTDVPTEEVSENDTNQTDTDGKKIPTEEDEDGSDPDKESTSEDDSAPVDLEASPDPGQRGTLYADPDNDGDFEAFDRFEDALTENDTK